MGRRMTSLEGTGSVAVLDKIGSKYDVVELVSQYLPEIEAIANDGIDELIAELNEAKDFTGITVVTGSPTSWDPVTKVLTVETVKGDDGYTPIKGVDYDDGEKGDEGYTPRKGVDYFDGTDGKTPVKGVDYQDGVDGSQGLPGVNGGTPVIEFSYNESTGYLEAEVVDYLISSDINESEEW